MGYRYSISTKDDGNMSYMWGKQEEVLINRRRFLKRANFDFDKCVTMKTTDSEAVKIVERTDMGKGMFKLDEAFQADALITTERDLGLFLSVADCAATIFYDEINSVLCLAHLNSMNPGLISTVISTLKNKYSTSPSNLQIFMGPSIKKESFIVPDPFQRKSKVWQNYIINLDKHLTAIDMVGFLRDELVSQGVSRKNIIESESDTYKDFSLFSHRRTVITGETEGRFAVVASLKK